MKKTFIYGLFGLLACLFSVTMASCGDDDDDDGSDGSLIGTWSMSESHNGEVYVKTLKISEKDWTLTTDIEYTENGKTNTESVRIGGTYTVSGNVVTAVSTISEYKDGNGKWVSQNNPQTVTYTWTYTIKGNKLTITQDNYTEVYTRK